MGDAEASRAKIRQWLGVSHLAFTHQQHGVGIQEVRLGTSGEVAPADVLVISEPGQGVLIKHADCQAAILYDPTYQVVAAVHCGWRGNVQNIYKLTIEHLQRTHGCQPEKLMVHISPSLGPEKAEFVNYRQEFPEHLWEHQWKPNYFDLWEMSHRQLTEAGVLSHHIDIAQVCTHANPQQWFSYRRDKTRERNATAVVLL